MKRVFLMLAFSSIVFGADGIVSSPSALTRPADKQVEKLAPKKKNDRGSKLLPAVTSQNAKNKLPVDWSKRDETTTPPPLTPPKPLSKLYNGPESVNLPPGIPSLLPSDETAR